MVSFQKAKNKLEQENKKFGFDLKQAEEKSKTLQSKIDDLELTNNDLQSQVSNKAAKSS